MVEVAPRITADPAVCHGQPVIHGTRVLVSILIGRLAGGMTVEAVADAYAVTREDVLAALSYAADAVRGEQLRPAKQDRASA